MIIRKATLEDAAGMARVHVDTWRTTYAGIVPDAFLANMSHDRSSRGWAAQLSAQGGTVAYVAEDPLHNIVGFAACGPERTKDPDYKGELYAIYVLKGEQQRGLGKLLVTAAARELRAAGLDSMIAWVLAENPSRLFYEAIGGTRVREKEIVIGEKKLLELGYGWNDLSKIAASSTEQAGGEEVS